MQIIIKIKYKNTHLKNPSKFNQFLKTINKYFTHIIQDKNNIPLERLITGYNQSSENSIQIHLYIYSKAMPYYNTFFNSSLSKIMK